MRSRTRLYTAAAKVDIHPTRATPRYRVLRGSPTVFIQPKISFDTFAFPLTYGVAGMTGSARINGAGPPSRVLGYMWGHS